MKLNRLLPAVVCSLAAGAAGYFWGKHDGSVPSAAARGPRIPVVATAGKAAAQASAATVFDDLLDGSAVTAQNGTDATMKVLSIPDPVRRMAVTSLLLESMTPENARAIYQGFVDLTTKTGRKTDGEWALMMRKFGSVLGEAGYREAGDIVFNRALAMEGWASVDPDAAERVIKGDKSFHSDINNAWLTGMCLKDPQKALQFALNGGSQALNAGPLMAQAIASSGIDGAQQALQAALDNSPPEAGASPEFHGLFSALVDTMFHRNVTQGTPEAMLPWIEKQKEQPYMNGSIIERGASEVWRAGKAEEAVAFLERMNTSRAAEDKLGRDLIYAQAFSNPQSLAAVSDETFKRALALTAKDPQRLKSSAAVLNALAPEKAAILLEAIPPPPSPPPAPAPQ